MIVECKNCGAPLDVQKGSAFARCSYCDHTNKVKSAKTLMAESPLNWVPPPVWQPPPQYKVSAQVLVYRPAPRSAPKRSGGCLAPLIGLATVAGIAGLVAYMSGAMTLLPYVGVDTNGAPRIGVVDPRVALSAPLRGEASGSHDASQLGAGCRGYIERDPHVILRSTEEAAVRLAAVDSDLDLVMVVRTANGQWLCDDDSGGSRLPLVSTTLPAGDNRVWVGTFRQSERSTFALHVDGAMLSGSTPEPSGLAPGATPSIGDVELGVSATNGQWPGRTVGWLEASSVDRSCRGYLPAAPHLRLTTATAREVELSTSENRNQDLVMLVRSPSGRIQCDDDSAGSLNPRVRTTLEPGTTAVWVGAFHQNGTADFQLALTDLSAPSASAAMPPRIDTVDLDVPGYWTRLRGTVEPDVPLRRIGASCRGYATEQHDLVILTTASRDLTLNASGSDLRLVVRGPDGVSCVSGNRAQATLRRTWTPGTYYVWIGTERRRATTYDLTLTQ